MSLTEQLSFGVAMQAFEGQFESGDQYIINQSSDDVLVAVVDGLGHGEEAAFAAKKVTSYVEKMPAFTSLIDIVHGCDAELRETRGAAMTLVQIKHTYEVNWIGIGNVVAAHWSHHFSESLALNELMTQGGIVGSNLPEKLRVSRTTVNPGDTLIIATDGILIDFMKDLPRSHVLPQTLADQILKKYRNPQDDSLVVVIRWPMGDSNV